MVLVDTSIWVDFLRKGNKTLAQLLSQELVCVHPMIIGELACGFLKNRKQLMSLWHNLPLATEAGHEEVLLYLEHNNLMGKGIGFIDLHLLASTQLSINTKIWTKDKRLDNIAQLFEINFV